MEKLPEGHRPSPGWEFLVHSYSQWGSLGDRVLPQLPASSDGVPERAMLISVYGNAQTGVTSSILMFECHKHSKIKCAYFFN